MNVIFLSLSFCFVSLIFVVAKKHVIWPRQKRLHLHGGGGGGGGVGSMTEHICDSFLKRGSGEI